MNHLTSLSHSGSVHGQNDSKYVKMSLFVRVVTHYGSNASNDSFGFFCVGPFNTVILLWNLKVMSTSLSLVELILFFITLQETSYSNYFAIDVVFYEGSLPFPLFFCFVLFFFLSTYDGMAWFQSENAESKILGRKYAILSGHIF